MCQTVEILMSETESPPVVAVEPCGNDGCDDLGTHKWATADNVFFLCDTHHREKEEAGIVYTALGVIREMETHIKCCNYFTALRVLFHQVAHELPHYTPSIIIKTIHGHKKITNALDDLTSVDSASKFVLANSQRLRDDIDTGFLCQIEGCEGEISFVCSSCCRSVCYKHVKSDAHSMAICSDCPTNIVLVEQSETVPEKDRYLCAYCDEDTVDQLGDICDRCFHKSCDKDYSTGYVSCPSCWDTGLIEKTKNEFDVCNDCDASQKKLLEM